MSEDKKPRYAFHVTLLVGERVYIDDRIIIATSADHAIFKAQSHMIAIREQAAIEAGKLAYRTALDRIGGVAGPEAKTLAYDAQAEEETRVRNVPLPLIMGVRRIDENEVIL